MGDIFFRAVAQAIAVPGTYLHSPHSCHLLNDSWEAQKPSFHATHLCFDGGTERASNSQILLTTTWLGGSA